MTTTTDAQTTADASRARMTPRCRLTPFAAATALAALLWACAAPALDVEVPASPPAPAPEPVPAPAPVPAAPADEADTLPATVLPEHPALVARAEGELDVYDLPGAHTPSRTLPATTAFGSPRALLVAVVGVGHDDGWLEVFLPVRPNGTTGWIRADAVELRTVAWHVTVDLDARELAVLDADEVVLTASVAIGDVDHPTPTGLFFITDKLDTADPGGPYGPYALGLSAWSDVLTEFAGGDGQVGIHGTDAPSSIGRAASHGCIRVENAVIEELARLLPLGTPVLIS